ncbi:hypothetical protein BDV25DRAFT_141489 [Aspergillus avenaceus]|uniref:FAD-binding PCMH-type domain-containing protein n=1 Tax=Aspergillus avenaceus TaxID=36643 RepID=A0A5N6TRH3_ASPAV|nr:hypothetical protein BDV25DRAFT_141489 [Aspergillus avenaceus]
MSSTEPVGLPKLQSLVIEEKHERNRRTSENHNRETIQALKEADEEIFNEILKGYTPSQRDLLKAFIDGESLGSVADKTYPDTHTAVGYQQNLELLKDARQTKLFRTILAPPVSGHDNNRPEEVQSLLTNDPEGQCPLAVFERLTFSNWGKTVVNCPLYTCIPTTIHGVQSIVKYAKEHGYGVRVSGYRHSWSPIFAGNEFEMKEFILISTLKLDRAVLGHLPNLEALGVYQNEKTELNKIEAISSNSSDISPDQQLVRVGCATTNEDLRRWCLSPNSGCKWTLPLNVIMVEITCGGSNGPICHGAGIQNKTLSDLVYAIEYVDANGNLQTIGREEPEMLSVASGCFGLLGVVTRLTLILDKMSVAFMEPLKLPVIEAIPPPDDVIECLPWTLKKSYRSYTPEQIQQFVKEFERRALNEYYAEWFWFPYHHQIWVNTWSKKEADPNDVLDYPSQGEIAWQIIQNFTFEMLQGVLPGISWLWSMRVTKYISEFAMDSLPQNKHTTSILTWLPDALHFRRGIQNARVRDLEVEIPLPTKDNLDIVRKAWWQVILLAYKPHNIAKCPMRMPLEMRIMGDSDVLMAPQRSNTNGTCSIEVLTPQSMEAKWPRFAQEVLNEWMQLRNWDNLDLNIRPHWAKEWVGLTVDGGSWVKYLKEKSYKDEIAKFTAVLEEIGDRQHWTLTDVKERFSNPLLDALFFK